MTLFVYALIGISVGYIYGLSFVHMYRRVFSCAKTTKNRNYIHLIGYPFFRIICLLIGLFFLLHLPASPLILILISATGSFWYVVMRKGM